jgi:hypothetical protein
MHSREREPRWGEGVRTYVSSAYARTNNYAVRTCILTYILGSERVHYFLFSVVRYICRGTYVRTYVNCTLGRENPVGGGGRYVRMHSQQLEAVSTCVLTYILGRESVYYYLFCVVRYICRGTYVRTYV